MASKESEKSDVDLLVDLIEKGAIKLAPSRKETKEAQAAAFPNKNAAVFVPQGGSGYQRTRESSSKMFKQQQEEQQERENFVPIPSQFAGLKCEIPLISEQLQIDTTIACLGGSISGPGEFYVIPINIWDDLESYQHKIQFAYLALIHGSLDYPYAESAPNPMSLIPGIYVVVWYDNEWHRAKIMKKLDQDDKLEQDHKSYSFRVQLIDYGDTFNAELKDIRYLMECFRDFPAAAFLCQLDVKNSRHEPMMKKDWNLKQCKAFLDVLYNRDLHLTLNDYFINDAGDKVWRVTMNILDKKNSKSKGKSFMSHTELEQYLIFKKK